ncbi:hypothetical protein GW17_00045476 [Ensete ventricosum]|nr:hypothetical protein GW17_00045476 [Ensete ventricosum]
MLAVWPWGCAHSLATPIGGLATGAHPYRQPPRKSRWRGRIRSSVLLSSDIHMMDCYSDTPPIAVPSHITLTQREA